MGPIVIALLIARDLLFPALGILGGVLLVTRTRAGRRVLDRPLTRPQDDGDMADLRAQVRHLQDGSRIRWSDSTPRSECSGDRSRRGFDGGPALRNR